MPPKIEDVMKYDKVLPEEFNGVFMFNNWSEEDFVGKWGGVEYLYPALSSSQMIIPEHSPLEIQNIRKKFAKDLAEREFFKTDKYDNLMKQEKNSDGSPRLPSFKQAGTYSENELVHFIQKALTSLPIAQATVTVSNRPKLEETVSKDDDGNIMTAAIKSDKDLQSLAKGNG